MRLVAVAEISWQPQQINSAGRTPNILRFRSFSLIEYQIQPKIPVYALISAHHMAEIKTAENEGMSQAEAKVRG